MDGSGFGHALGDAYHFVFRAAIFGFFWGIATTLAFLGWLLHAGGVVIAVIFVVPVLIGLRLAWRVS